MAKRFFDTSVFRKDFVRGLDAPCKLLWFYILAECDHAGIWDAEIDVAQVRLGVKINGDPIKCMQGRVIPLDGGRKWFIPSFVEFQYGRLNPDNRAHASVISILGKHGLLDSDFNIIQQTPCKPLASPLQGAMDMDKDKEMDTDKDKVNARAKKLDPADLIPETWSRQEFLDNWADFEKVRKAKKKPITDTAIKQLVGKLKSYAGEDWAVANQIMLNAITHSWDGFYPLKPEEVEKLTPQVETDFWGNPIKQTA